MLDTDGEPLRLAMRAEPDLVSPNELESEELVGQEFTDVYDRAQAVIEMTRLGAGEAIMTVSDGCYARLMENGTPDPLPGQDPGAGGPLGGRLRGRLPGRVCRVSILRPGPRECLRFGVACGAESTQHFGAGLIDATRVERLLGEVEAERLQEGAEIS